MAPGDCVDAPTWNHLWFVAYLWVYSAVLWAACLVLPQAWREKAADFVRAACSGQGILWWPMLVLAGARVLVYPHAPSSHDLVDDAYNHLQYGLVFAIGYLLTSADGVWERLRRYRHRMLLLTGTSYVLMLTVFFAFDGLDPIPSPWMSLIWSLWGVMEWAAITAILGYARSWNPPDSPRLRYLTAAVFPFYILHQTVIVVLAHSLKPLHITPALEGPLLIGATFALCLLGYEIIRRVPLLRPLFGLKRAAKRPLPPAGAPQPAG
jgi:surface polysaccharide O-acyltransferase-like enzyme